MATTGCQAAKQGCRAAASIPQGCVKRFVHQARLRFAHREENTLACCGQQLSTVRCGPRAIDRAQTGYDGADTGPHEPLPACCGQRRLCQTYNIRCICKGMCVRGERYGELCARTTLPLLRATFRIANCSLGHPGLQSASSNTLTTDRPFPRCSSPPWLSVHG
jgi:hypothetical protein